VITSTLDHFQPRNNPDNYGVGSWMGSRAGMGCFEKRISGPPSTWQMKPIILSYNQWQCHYTSWALAHPTTACL